MSIIFSTPAVMCWHTHGMSTFWITLQHCWDGFIFGIPFWTYNLQSTLSYQTLHVTLAVVANNHVVVVTGEQNPSNGEESQEQDVSIEVHCHISLTYCMCVCVGWFIGVVRDGFYRGFEGKIRMKNLAFEPWNWAHCMQNHALFTVLVVQMGWYACEQTYFFTLKYN